ncbi:polyphosphate kinase 1 [Algoriphagus sp. Y33]|uniref:polyphosphate kinase 1 n=1 Tax=Algoriphagus sp. Y33 TaxID=2772483 RepID=UPI00177CB391|nr:polyphosphate kinase 1 [Algoriphagus sp. Y33]
MTNFTYANRDLSWLSFNKQVLCEALAEEIPLRERINFLAIFSSNLDEFYRVRYPVVQFLAQSPTGSNEEFNPCEIKEKVDREIADHQALMGKILRKIRAAIKKEGIEWIYDKKIPDMLKRELADFFTHEVMGKLHIIEGLSSTSIEVFAPNSKVFMVFSHPDKKQKTLFIPLPTPVIPRFLTFKKGEKKYVVFLEDLIKHELIKYRPELEGCQAYTFKVNRNAEMNLEEEVATGLSKRLKKEIKRREFGSPTRLLYQKGMPEFLLDEIQQLFRLETVNMVEGGAYHQLQDLFGFPLDANPSDHWRIIEPEMGSGVYFLDEIFKRDILIHPPYHSFSPVLRLFNEAAIHPEVYEINLTIYRVAKDSKILQALITAAQNGKKVTVFVELKARFDEENNLNWAEKMKAVGVRIKYSIPKLKVHAKAALIKLKKAGKIQKIALLGTGNFNESTAKVYTDHFLFTGDPLICRELEDVFKILAKSPKKPKKEEMDFSILWVGKFNLKEQLLKMIQSETQEALLGGKAEIFLKMNNLEEEDVIGALYQASQSGVKIRLLIRGICRLIPGIKGQSEGITVKRIVDHYLEHGRIFSFFSKGKHVVYIGSADWMDRNLNRRIEVCFPIRDERLKSEISTMLELQWNDNRKAHTFPITNQVLPLNPLRSQAEICSFLLENSHVLANSERFETRIRRKEVK